MTTIEWANTPTHHGVITHWGERAHYGFVRDDSNVEYVLQDEELPSWLRDVEKANGCTSGAKRVGLKVDFTPIDVMGRWQICKNVFVS
jgi:hypothetical protein